MGIFNSNGYQRERLDVWKERIEDIYYSIFGLDIDISSSTQDGQLIGALAEKLSQADEMVEAVSKSFDPSQATGNALSTLVQINRLNRKDATKTVVELTLSGVNGTFIPAGSLVRSSVNDEQFATNIGVTIESGTAVVTATALSDGQITAVTGTVTIIDDNISGWTSVTNSADGVVGRLEESDSELRIRRRQSTSLNAFGTADAVNGYISGLEGVTLSHTSENTTESTNPDGIPAKSIASIVEGGDEDEIAAAILLKKSCGCGTYGTITRYPTDSQLNPVEIKFSRPDYVPVYIDITIRNIGGLPSDIEDKIKDSIVAFYSDKTNEKVGIGKDIIYSDLFIPITSVATMSVSDIFLDTITPPVSEVDLNIQYNQLAQFDASRINVTVI